MGTRGFVGFVAEGRETIVYNHSDSYPEELGINVLHYARGIDDRAAAKASAAAIIHVSDETPPTEKQIDALSQYANLSVGRRGDRPDWYQLLRETQGDPAAILKAGHAEHFPEWPTDALYCEWGYLIDFDREVLEVYRGYQTAAHADGRFHDRATTHAADGYHPVRLIASYSLDDLPTNERILSLDR